MGLGHVNKVPEYRYLESSLYPGQLFFTVLGQDTSMKYPEHIACTIELIHKSTCELNEPTTFVWHSEELIHMAKFGA